VQQWITIWFQWVHDWGYPGIILLMAMESSVFPIPSEIVIPPAAYWATQGRYSLVGVVLAGTMGSYIGAAFTYWVARWVGRPLFLRFGRYIFVSPKKILRAERWLLRYEAGGVFFARLVPVVRHLIGIPAGIVRMPFGLYSAVTLAGAGLWCAVLAWFGVATLGDHPDLLEDPARLAQVLGQQSFMIGGFALVLCILYVTVLALTAPVKQR
jgi:membrane protein DedA with SNARE-associated domain